MTEKRLVKSLINCIDILLELNIIGCYEADKLKYNVIAGDITARYKITQYLQSIKC